MVVFDNFFADNLAPAKPSVPREYSGIVCGGVPPGNRILTLFQSKKSHFPHPFSYLASKIQTCFQTFGIDAKVKGSKSQQKTGKILPNAILCLPIFLSHSFGEEKINSATLSRGSLECHTQFQTIMVKIYTHFQTNTAQKPYPLGRHISL